MANNCKQTIPYWSTAPGRKVYHNCKNCTIGNNIESNFLASNAKAPAKRSLCYRCKEIRAGRLTR
jgi:hypothetical protein